MTLLTLTPEQRLAVVCALVDNDAHKAITLLQQYHRRATTNQLMATLTVIRSSLTFGTVSPR